MRTINLTLAYDGTGLVGWQRQAEGIGDAKCSCPGRACISLTSSATEVAGTLEFTTHSLAPEAVLALAHEHLGARTRGFLLGIRGYHFDDYGERLSAAAARNLEQASAFVARALRDGRLASGPPCTVPGGETHGRGD